MRRILFFFIAFVSLFALAYHLAKSPSGSEKANAQVCSITPVDVVLVIDRSGSMTGQEGSSGTKLSNAKAAARRFINIVDSSNGSHNIGIVSYSTYGSVDHVLSNDYQNARTAVNAISAGGNTCIECGIFRANQTIGNRGRNGAKKIVVLLTDGQANVTQASQPGLANPENAENAAINEAKKGHNEEGTIYYTIGLGNDLNQDDKNFLREIAGIGTGARFYDSPTTDQLEGIFEKIADEIFAKGVVSGFVFKDQDSNNSYNNPPDSILTGWELNLVRVNDDGTEDIIKSVLTGGDGRFNIQDVCNGNYKLVQVTQGGYHQTFPVSGGGYNFSITSSSFLALNKDFGNAPDTVIPPPPSWIQSLGGDVRDDHGTRNLIPGNNHFSESELPRLSHGVVFLASNYNLGAPTADQRVKANSSGWLVSGVNFSPSMVKMSYVQMVRNLTRGGIYRTARDLFGGSGSPCGGAGPDCNLSTSLSQGIYKSESQNVNLTNSASYQFQPNSKYVFLIRNNLTIKTDIIVPQGTSVIFIVGGDINVASNVGRIDGIFSTDNNFSVENNAGGIDEQLLVNGNIIANASLKHRLGQLPGTLKGERNLGAFNDTTPGIQVKTRTDFILNAPELVRAPNFNRVEVNPGE